MQVISADTPVPGDMLDDEGSLRLRPAADYDAIPRDSLRLWCHLHGRYGLPTAETVAWLRDFIGGRTAIEIGSGAGDLARHLGIPATDSHVQERPDVAAFYRATGQPTVRYPGWVERAEALEAVRRHRPEVVVASWVTHWISPDMPPPPGGGSVYGVREDELLGLGVTYVHIGNEAIHAAKPILRMPHGVHALPFLRSRASRPELDRIWVWA